MLQGGFGVLEWVLGGGSWGAGGVSPIILGVSLTFASPPQGCGSAGVPQKKGVPPLAPPPIPWPGSGCWCPPACGRPRAASSRVSGGPQNLGGGSPRSGEGSPRTWGGPQNPGGVGALECACMSQNSDTPPPKVMTLCHLFVLVSPTPVLLSPQMLSLVTPDPLRDL